MGRKIFILLIVFCCLFFYSDTHVAKAASGYTIYFVDEFTREPIEGLEFLEVQWGEGGQYSIELFPELVHQKFTSKKDGVFIQYGKRAIEASIQLTHNNNGYRLVSRENCMYKNNSQKICKMTDDYNEYTSIVGDFNLKGEVVIGLVKDGFEIPVDYKNKKPTMDIGRLHPKGKLMSADCSKLLILATMDQDTWKKYYESDKNKNKALYYTAYFDDDLNNDNLKKLSTPTDGKMSSIELFEGGLVDMKVYDGNEYDQEIKILQDSNKKQQLVELKKLIGFLYSIDLPKDKMIGNHIIRIAYREEKNSDKEGMVWTAMPFNDYMIVNCSANGSCLLEGKKIDKDDQKCCSGLIEKNGKCTKQEEEKCIAENKTVKSGQFCCEGLQEKNGKCVTSEIASKMKVKILGGAYDANKTTKSISKNIVSMNLECDGNTTELTKTSGSKKLTEYGNFTFNVNMPTTAKCTLNNTSENTDYKFKGYTICQNKDIPNCHKEQKINNSNSIDLTEYDLKNNDKLQVRWYYEKVGTGSSDSGSNDDAGSNTSGDNVSTSRINRLIELLEKLLEKLGVK